MNDLVTTSGEIKSKGFIGFEPGKVHFIYAPSPVHFYRNIYNEEPGQTIAQVLAKHGVDVEHVHVQLNKAIIPRAMFDIVLQADDVLGARIVPEDKSALGLLMQLGIIAAAAAASVFTGGLAAGAIIMVAGQLLERMLIQPPNTPQPNVNSVPVRYSISGDLNNIAKWATHPKVHGDIQVTPTQYGLPYTEPRQRIQYLRALFSVGYGPADISQIKINNALLSTYEEVEVQIRYGFPDDTDTTNFTNTISAQDLSVVLLDVTPGHNTTGTGWHSEFSASGCSQIQLEISAPQGLGTTNDSSGNTRWVKVRHNVQYAPIGTPHGVSGNDNWTNRPDLFIQGVSTEVLRVFDIWEVDPILNGYEIRVQAIAVTVQPGGATGVGNTLRDSTTWTKLDSIKPKKPVNIKNQTLIDMRIRANGQLSGEISNLTAQVWSIERDWDARTNSWDSYAGGWDYDYITSGGGGIYGLDSITPHTTGGKALFITIVSGASAYVASKAQPVRGAHQKTNTFGAPFAGEIYKASVWYKSSSAIASGLRIRVLYSRHEDFASTDIISALTVFNGAAGTSWGQQIMASVDDAHRAPRGAKYARLEVGINNTSGGTITVEFDDCFLGRIDDHFNGPNICPNPSFDYSGRKTSNPASHFRHILQQPEGGMFLPDSKLNLLALQTWHEDNITNGYMFDGLFDQETNIDAALDSICAIGHATKIISADLNTVVQDKPSNAVVQVWSEINYKKLTWTRDVPDLYHGYHTTFKNAQKQYQQDEVTVFDDGYSAAGPGAVAAEVIGTGNGGTHYAIGVSGWPVTPGSMVITLGSGGGSMTDAVTHLVLNGSLGTGSYDPTKGWMTLDFASPVPNGVQILAAYFGFAGTVPGTVFGTLNLTVGVTSLALAFKLARLHLAQPRYRPDLFTIDTDIEMIKCQLADRCLLQAQLLGFGSKAGRVAATNVDGSGNLLGVTLDEPVHLDLGMTYMLRFKIPDATATDITIPVIIPGTTTGSDTDTDSDTDITGDVDVGDLAGGIGMSGDYTVVEFATPIPSSSPQPHVGDSWTFGMMEDSQPVVVQSIAPEADYTAQLGLMVYDERIVGAEDYVPPTTSDALVGTQLPIAQPLLDSMVSARTSGTMSESGTMVPAINVSLLPNTMDSQFVTRNRVMIEAWHRRSGAQFANDRGEWNVGTAYLIGDQVSRTYMVGSEIDSVSYHQAQNNNSGMDPLTDVAEVYWSLVSLDDEWTKNPLHEVSPTVRLQNIDVAQSYEMLIRYIANEKGIVGPWLYARHQVVSANLGIDSISNVTGAFFEGQRDEVTSSTTLIAGSYTVIAAATYSADPKSLRLRFMGGGILNLASFDIHQDEIDAELVIDGTGSVGSAISGGTVVKSFPIKFSHSTTGTTSNPDITFVIPSFSKVPTDTSPHTYTLCIKLVNNSGSFHGTADYALLEVLDHRRGIEA